MVTQYLTGYMLDLSPLTYADSFSIKPLGDTLDLCSWLVIAVQFFRAICTIPASFLAIAMFNETPSIFSLTAWSRLLCLGPLGCNVQHFEALTLIYNFTL